MGGVMNALARRRGSVFGLFVAASLCACGSRPLSPPPIDPDPMDRSTYVIGVLDVIQVTVWKNAELNATVPVRSDGKISVPLVDDVQAEGLTPMELKEVLTKELSEFIVAPDVTVTVVGSNSQFVSLVGEIGRQGRVPLSRDLRVLEAIAVAGGFAPFADKSDIRIVRRQPDGSEREYRFDYKAYIKGKAPGTNIVLQNGDTIIVQE
jgi:polysaccharide export outer membrane protein